jgi:hypothetical protein
MEELAWKVRVDEEEFSGHRKLGKPHSGRRVAELTRICRGLYNDQTVPRPKMRQVSEQMND